MEILEYVVPIRNSSRKEVRVEDLDGNKILGLQKFYKNKIEFIFALLKPRMFTNIKVMKNAKTIIQSNDIFTLGRPKWDIEIRKNKETNETVRLKNVSVVSTHPRAEFNLEGQQYKVTHNLGERTTTVYAENEDIIAELKYEKIIPTKHNTLKIFKSGLDASLLLCILHTFEESQ